MITLVLGGARKSQLFEEINQASKSGITPIVLASPGALKLFCQRVWNSCKPIVKFVPNDSGYGLKRTTKKANDDFSIHFDSLAIEKINDEGSPLFRIATVIELALDCGLDIKVTALGATYDMFAPFWPKQWPQLIKHQYEE